MYIYLVILIAFLIIIQIICNIWYYLQHFVIDLALTVYPTDDSMLVTLLTKNTPEARIGKDIRTGIEQQICHHNEDYSTFL